MNKIFILFVILNIIVFYNCSKKEELNLNENKNTSKTTEKDLIKYRVKSKILKLRRGPGKNFEEIITLNKNDEVIYIDKVETRDEGIWYLVQKKIEGDTDKYIEGFASSIFLEEKKEGDK